MSVIFGSARSSYGNTKRGDQNGGKEVSTQEYYLHSLGWRVFRAKTAAQRKALGDAMLAACNEKKGLIGYSQPDRLALFNQVKDRGYDPAKVTEPTNCDCSSLVRVCCYYAGIKPSNFITSSEPSALLKTGEFVELTDSKYTKKSDYLMYGDILVTRSKGHTGIICSNGSKAKADNYEPERKYVLGDRELENGCEGDDVKELQRLLIGYGYSCGDYGIDGEFGDDTEAAVTRFQRDNGLAADGVAGKNTITELLTKDMTEASDTGTSVKIRGGNCYVRSKPNTSGSKLGTAHKGTSYIYGGQTSVDGWLMILYNGKEGWVSGKYAERY